MVSARQRFGSCHVSVYIYLSLSVYLSIILLPLPLPLNDSAERSRRAGGSARAMRAPCQHGLEGQGAVHKLQAFL